MELGNFSVSLNVANIKESKEFYENLGFEVIFGEEKDKWLIMKNGTTKIGLFEGMFENNILTFNPKWNEKGIEDSSMSDIKEIYQSVVDNDLNVISPLTEKNFMITDPDGNVILFDQHI